MIPLKPYLIRSIYDWILDNQFTPHLLVDAKKPNTQLPRDYVENGTIVLNMHPEAIKGLTLGNEVINFSAVFSGSPMHIVAPIPAILAIYAKENGKGMVFDSEDHDDDTPPPSKESNARPKLRIVK